MFRREYGRAVAVLVRSLRDISLAEEAVQEAFLAAVARWPQDGIPPAPAGWIITTARNRAIDRLRREASRDERQAASLQWIEQAESDPEPDVRDERLRLMFTCCHPSLAPEARVALTLRLLGGLTTGEIARAFLVGETTMGQRLSRAKAKIRDAGIPYRVPDADELPGRLGAVLASIYLVFNEGYSAAGGGQPIRGELCDEAIRLGRLMVELMPAETEVHGLLALMLFIDARRAARIDAAGQLVMLPQQDRSRWDAARLEEARALMRACLARNRPGPYQLQAAINAVHSDASAPACTDWRQILALYDQWMTIAPSPVVALNRAVVVAEVEDPALALRLVDDLDLAEYHLFHAVRADLLGRLGRDADAASACRRALSLATNDAERRHLGARLRTLES